MDCAQLLRCFEGRIEDLGGEPVYHRIRDLAVPQEHGVVNLQCARVQVGSYHTRTRVGDEGAARHHCAERGNERCPTHTCIVFVEGTVVYPHDGCREGTVVTDIGLEQTISHIDHTRSNYG